MISGVAAAFWISNLWKYSKKVSKIQKQLVIFKAKHEEQELKIVHAVKQHTRLAQQQPLVEPILEVLAKAYRVQIQSDVSARAQVTTHFDPALLPACVTLARAVDDDEVKMARLRRRALSPPSQDGGVFRLPSWARILTVIPKRAQTGDIAAPPPISTGMILSPTSRRCSPSRPGF